MWRGAAPDASDPRLQTGTERERRARRTGRCPAQDANRPLKGKSHGCRQDGTGLSGVATRRDEGERTLDVSIVGPPASAMAKANSVSDGREEEGPTACVAWKSHRKEVPRIKHRREKKPQEGTQAAIGPGPRTVRPWLVKVSDSPADRGYDLRTERTKSDARRG